MTRPSIEIIFGVEEVPEGGFVARALGHSIFTEAQTLDRLCAAVRDAVRCHFADGDRPEVIRLRFLHGDPVTITSASGGDPFACFEEWTSEADAFGYSTLGGADRRLRD